jgi:ornithine cyclodeaminase
MREMLIAHTDGHYFSPPRVSMMLGAERVLFSAGGALDGAMALRVSGTAASNLEHLAISWRASGEIDAVIVGNEVGARRTGAVAAVAADLLARPGEIKVGIIGSGRNGWAQIWGLTGARQIVELKIYSPNPRHREQFAERAARELGLSARATTSAEAAVSDADVVVLCTTSRTPVLEAGWIDDGVHVTSIGAKTTTAHEVPGELLDRVGFAASDAPNEIDSPVTDLGATPLLSLGSLLVAGGISHDPEKLSLFLYAGLGASDAYFVQAVAKI